MLDDRSKLLLKALVERYIADGQPVGSRTLARAAGLELSPATVRNVMSDLEELGLIASPHTSAGRVPTARGYRLFVDTMLTARRDDVQTVDAMPPATLQGEQPRLVINQAAQLLSSLSHFVGVVRVPKRVSVFRHIEFLSLSQRRVLVILVSPDGEVQNHVIHTQTEFEQSRLQEAANFLNAHYAGLTLVEVRDRLRAEVESLRGEISSLMLQAVELGSESDAQQDAVVVAGERNLLSVSDFTHDLGQLRRLFDLFEQKTQIMRLLDVSHQAEGVRIYIGGDSQGGVPFEDLSVVSAPYTVDGTVVGTLGVIGPQRMPYERMIQIVDITAKLVGNALSQPRQ
jgi:heat-inducible transcriptional repressor